MIRDCLMVVYEYATVHKFQSDGHTDLGRAPSCMSSCGRSFNQAFCVVAD